MPTGGCQQLSGNECQRKTSQLWGRCCFWLLVTICEESDYRKSSRLGFAILVFAVWVFVAIDDCTTLGLPVTVPINHLRRRCYLFTQIDASTT